MRLHYLLFVILFFEVGFTQQSEVYVSHITDFQNAVMLYKNGQYKAAQAAFVSVNNSTADPLITSECEYYIATSAIRLNQNNADTLIENFVDNHPTSIRQNSAFLDVANYYFNNTNYAYASKWYQKLDASSLKGKLKDEFNFNYGYTLYTLGNKRQATKYLQRVVDSKTYGSQAKYYIGYMAYEGDDYDTASDYFNQVSGNEKYKEKLSYYEADLNFKLGKFEKAIALAKPQLSKSRAEETSELSKIIGESYFNLEQYSEALPYLKAYKGKKGKWNNTDFYQLGYTYYKQKEYKKAISEFNKIINGNSSTAQNAYYHLGESYINLGKKQEALNAFRNASQMSFDPQIKADAWLNYAKLSYEIGNPYQSVPKILTDYLDAYPDTNAKEEIETLLIDSYITSKNYEDALELLKGKNSFNHKSAYQKVAYLRGIELYNITKYNEALKLFNNSLKHPIDTTYVSKATFWKAQTDYNLTNYNEALIGFKQFAGFTESSSLTAYNNLDYNLAYTYFKLKNYTAATTYFKQFLDKDSADVLRRNDAFLRLGDGYFVSSNYKEAIAAYNEAIKLKRIETDYAAFQKAMSQGYLGKSKLKISELSTFVDTYKTSALRDDAIYDLANTYVKANEVNKAMNAYIRLQKEHPNSPFLSKAILRQGLVYFNQNNNQEALKKFKAVAKNYSNTPEAFQAVSSARLIYVDMGEVEAYANWVKTLDFVELSNVELDNTMYSSAEKPYLDGNTDKAIRQFNNYINEFPKGLHALKSHFYLGQMYYKKQLFENALPHYEAVISSQKSEFTEQALVKLSSIYLDSKNWNKSIQVLKRLETEADYPQNIVYAQSNLMNAYYQTSDYIKAVSYADAVLNNSNLDPKISNDAQLIIARSAMKTNNESKAKIAYEAIESKTTGAVAAEALYYRGYFQNQDKKFEASNATMQRLAKDYSSYKYYSAKGLVIMAKNFYALQDAFQATYILESVISNFTEFTDVIEAAKAELKIIKSQEAKTNSSIETDDN